MQLSDLAFISRLTCAEFQNAIICIVCTAGSLYVCVRYIDVAIVRPKHKSHQTTNPGRRARGADQNQSQLQECVHAGERKTDHEECIRTDPLEKQEETE